MEKKWEELSLDEKQEEMFSRWSSPQGATFSSAEAEKSYKARVARIKDAVQLKKLPDRVPVFPIVGFFPAYYAGITPQVAMYDYEKRNAAWKKYVYDFQPDVDPGVMSASPGIIYDMLDYKLYSWPGHGVSPNVSYQCIEGEYMKADEYDALIDDPSFFFSNIYLPRVFGVMQPFQKLPVLTSILEMYAGMSAVSFIPYGLPDVQEAYKKLMETGTETLKWIGSVGAYGKEVLEAGWPAGFGGGCKAPFDTIGDTLRGTRGISMDLYRQPQKLLKALERMTPIMIKMGVSAAKANNNPIVFIPLHKGADGFLSDEQFRKFYWPTFRELLMGIINEGCVPFSYAEGGYNSRLEIIKDLPRGKAIWAFDQTDMAKAKKILGNNACIGGNIPSAILNVGTKEQVIDYTRKLIDTAGKGGGYIMMNGAVIDDTRVENVKAWIDFSMEYGVYK
ncbi:MAG TPA: uroporphyrinogen decarboxylase family protein [Dehalococcoidia bacterium]|nr:uroporphyrinogen decarboxylase family protein [Dehalococcoidia bacterium]